MTALSGTFLGGAVIGASAGLTNGLISGYGFARLGGSSVGQALLSGLKSGAIGLASGAIIGGTVQGISNVYHGRNFWTGKPSVSAASVANSASSTANQPADPAKYEKYPPNDGALGSWHEETLQPGTVVDRYGVTKESSVFASPKGTSADARSLLEGTDLGKYHAFEIIKPVRVKSSIIAPWNGHAGGGIQYKFERPILELEDLGFIKEILKK